MSGVNAALADHAADAALDAAPGRITTHADGSITYQLRHELVLCNAHGTTIETITELTLHRLNGKSMRDIANAKDKGSGEALTVLICGSARLPRSQFDQLDAEDVGDLGVIAGNFIGTAPATTST